MRLCYLNLVSAGLAVLGGILWLLLGEAVPGLVWLGVSLVWLLLAGRSLSDTERERFPFRRLARRISRLLLFGS